VVCPRNGQPLTTAISLNSRLHGAGILERSEDHVLRDLVDTESRSYSGERFNRFIAELYSRIKALVQR
jgi:hypothetical protein